MFIVTSFLNSYIIFYPAALCGLVSSSFFGHLYFTQAIVRSILCSSLLSCPSPTAPSLYGSILPLPSVFIIVLGDANFCILYKSLSLPPPGIPFLTLSNLYNSLSFFYNFFVHIAKIECNTTGRYCHLIATAYPVWHNCQLPPTVSYRFPNRFSPGLCLRLW